MHKASSIVLTVVGMLLWVVSLADSAESPGTDGEHLPALARSVPTLLSEPIHAYRWRVLLPAKAMIYPDKLSRPSVDLHFQNDSALAQISTIHSLSLLTLAETRLSRLFLGVNAEGLVGLHFGASSRRGDEQYLELVRMPYLKKTTSDSQVEQPRPE